MGRASVVQLAQPSGRRVVKGSRRAVQPQPQAGNLQRAAGEVALGSRHADPTRVLFTMREAADYLRYTGDSAPDSAYHWLKRHGVALKRRGTVCLVRLSDIDAVLDKGSSDFVARALAHRGGR